MVLLSGMVASAQQEKRPCMSDEGYWVIEGNRKTPKVCLVNFYTNNGILVYKEAVTGRRINIRRKKTVLQLNEALARSIAAFHNKQQLTGDLLAKKTR